VELVLLVTILAIGGQSVWLLKDRSDRLESGVDGQASGFREEPLPEHSVAVLPCTSLGRGEGQSYFADGLAAELITRLALAMAYSVLGERDRARKYRAWPGCSLL
jgi:hypothetical protein